MVGLLEDPTVLSIGSFSEKGIEVFAVDSEVPSPWLFIPCLLHFNKVGHSLFHYFFLGHLNLKDTTICMFPQPGPLRFFTYMKIKDNCDSDHTLIQD